MNQYGTTAGQALTGLVGGGAAGSAGYPMTPQDDLPRLNVVQNGLGYALNNLDSVLSRLTKLADRLGGSVPQEVSKTGQAEPAQPPVVVGLERSTEQLNMRLEYIFKQIERLEKF